MRQHCPICRLLVRTKHFLVVAAAVRAQSREPSFSPRMLRKPREGRTHRVRCPRTEENSAQRRHNPDSTKFRLQRSRVKATLLVDGCAVSRG